ncbi:hypothetical protein RugamoR64_62150 [Duganella rhizosphaerae]|uniref:type IV secretion system protein VirB10 n=1 Tax=Duganella rhizosphaerae TaxID=2885763 RepID=UPI0030EA3A85
MNTITNTPSDEPIDRDIPDLSVGKKKNNVTRLITAGVLLLAIVIAVVGLSMFMKQLEKNKRESVAEKAKARPKAAALTSVASTDIRAAQTRIEKQEQADETAAAQASAQAAATSPAKGTPGQLAMPADAIGVTPTGAKAAAGARQGQGAGNAAQGAPSSAATGGAPAAPHMSRAQRQMDGDVLVTGGSGGASALGDDGSRRAASPSAAAGPVRTVAAGAADVARNGLDDKVKPSALLAGKAGQRTDLTMLLQRGTSIPCGDISAISSEQPGMVMCLVSNDVWSSDGKVVLIEKGSKAFGERREAMLRGQKRIGAVWTRIDTPYGVFADVNSLATDPLGRAGIPADVDNHLSERFGGAILLSLIGDAGQALANRANNGGGTIQFSNTATAGQDLATKTLENTINIPPTGYVNQGEVNTIFVLRDMDFRGVYELARK